LSINSSEEIQMEGRNEPGVTSSFYFQESRGVNRKTWLDTPTLHTSSWAGWWIGHPGGGKSDKAYHRLTHLGTDGAQWKVEVRLETVRDGNGNPYFICEFETYKLPNHGRKRSQWIGVVDWEGTHWKVEIIREVISSNNTPQFRLSR
jgi:hypothetical protein